MNLQKIDHEQMKVKQKVRKKKPNNVIRKKRLSKTIK